MLVGLAGHFFGDFAKGFLFGKCPHDKSTGIFQTAKREARRATDPLIDNHRCAAPRLTDGDGASAVRCDESGFGGGQRHVEITLGEQAVHTQRSGKSDRHLHGPDQVLDVVLVSFQSSDGLFIGQSGTGFRSRSEQAPSFVESLRRNAGATWNTRGGRCGSGAKARRHSLKIGSFKVVMEEKVSRFTCARRHRLKKSYALGRFASLAHQTPFSGGLQSFCSQVIPFLSSA